MRIKLFNLLIIAGFVGFYSYGLFLLNQEKESWELILYISPILVFITLGASLGIDIANKKTLYGIRILSIVFLIIFAVLGLIFSCMELFSHELFFIIHGILFLLYVSLIKSVVSLKNTKR